MTRRNATNGSEPSCPERDKPAKLRAGLAVLETHPTNLNMNFNYRGASCSLNSQ